ncbi:MAG: VCBS repeat-containing protein [Bdellovibrionales bacterium]|nr:VCBS repeat-containing protein [Bdellovibrionales bacterium]
MKISLGTNIASLQAQRRLIAVAGAAIFTMISNGDGTFQAAESFALAGTALDVDLADIDGDNHLDALYSRGGNIYVAYGDGAGNFGVETLVQDFGSENSREFITADYDGDGDIDILGYNQDALEFYVLRGDGAGNFATREDYSLTVGFNVGHQELSIADLNDDGNLDVVVAGGGAGVDVFLGKADGTFEAAVSYAHTGESRSVTIADFNGDGANDILTSGGAGHTVPLFLGNISETSFEGINGLPTFSLLSESSAKDALTIMNGVVELIATDRGTLGAASSRLSVALSSAQVGKQLTAEASSRIRDADIAQESANLVRLQILQQASAAILASANETPSLVLQLLS